MSAAVPDGVEPTGRRPLDELFAALSDPTRRMLLESLVHNGPRTATELSVGLPVTRQAVVKHLQALAGADLAIGERDGREVRYRATTERLAEAVQWLLDNSADWDRRLERLKSKTTKPKQESRSQRGASTAKTPQRRRVGSDVE